MTGDLKVPLLDAHRYEELLRRRALGESTEQLRRAFALKTRKQVRDMISHRKRRFLDVCKTLGVEPPKPTSRPSKLTHGQMGRILCRYAGGEFPPPPDALRGRGVRFTFVSPVEQARKQTEAAGMARFFELVAPLVQFQPEIMDNLDGDEIVRDAPDVSGMPRRWLRSKDRVEDLRGQRAQAQQAAALLDDAGQAADVARTAAGIPGIGQGT